MNWATLKYGQSTKYIVKIDFHGKTETAISAYPTFYWKIKGGVSIGRFLDPNRYAWYCLTLKFLLCLITMWNSF